MSGWPPFLKDGDCGKLSLLAIRAYSTLDRLPIDDEIDLASLLTYTFQMVSFARTT
jgi:hypothetical protein